MHVWLIPESAGSPNKVTVYLTVYVWPRGVLRNEEDGRCKSKTDNNNKLMAFTSAATSFIQNICTPGRVTRWKLGDILPVDGGKLIVVSLPQRKNRKYKCGQLLVNTNTSLSLPVLCKHICPILPSVQFCSNECKWVWKQMTCMVFYYVPDTVFPEAGMRTGMCCCSASAQREKTYEPIMLKEKEETRETCREKQIETGT